VVVHVGIRRLGELVWVAAEVLVLDWKGRREWGYSYACRNMQVMGAGVGGGGQGSWCWWWLKWCSVSGPCAVSWQIEDGGDMNRAVDGARKQQPPGPTFMPTQPHLLPHCNGARNRGSDGEWRGAMAAFSRLTGRVGVGEAEKREGGEGQSASMLAVEMGTGVVCGLLVVWLFGAMRSRFEVQDGFAGVGLGRALCAAVTRGWQSVILTAASVDYCLEVVILGNRMKKKVLLTFYCCFWEIWSGEAGRT